MPSKSLYLLDSAESLARSRTRFTRAILLSLVLHALLLAIRLQHAAQAPAEQNPPQPELHMYLRAAGDVGATPPPDRAIAATTKTEEPKFVVSLSAPPPAAAVAPPTAPVGGKARGKTKPRQGNGKPGPRKNQMQTPRRELPLIAQDEPKAPSFSVPAPEESYGEAAQSLPESPANTGNDAATAKDETTPQLVPTTAPEPDAQAAAELARQQALDEEARRQARDEETHRQAALEAQRLAELQAERQRIAEAQAEQVRLDQLRTQAEQARLRAEREAEQLAERLASEAAARQAQEAAAERARQQALAEDASRRAAQEAQRLAEAKAEQQRIADAQAAAAARPSGSTAASGGDSRAHPGAAGTANAAAAAAATPAADGAGRAVGNVVGGGASGTAAATGTGGKAKSEQQGMAIATQIVPPADDCRQTVAGPRLPSAQVHLYAVVWRHLVRTNAPYYLLDDLKTLPHVDPIVSVSIRSDGMVEKVSFERSSGRTEIDRAVWRMIHSLAPYTEFPRNLAIECEVIEFPSYWSLNSGLNVSWAGE